MPAQLKIELPKIEEVFKQLGLTAALALTRAMDEAVQSWKDEIRPQIRKVFKSTPAKARKLGLNFEKSFQGTRFPLKKKRKVAFRPAGWLNANAGFAEIFETGGVSRPRHGKYLAIALPAARRLNLDYGYAQSGHGNRFTKRSMVEDAEAHYGPFRRIKARGGRIILAASTAGGGAALASRSTGVVSNVKARGKKRNFVPLFLLVKFVVDPKRLNFLATAKKAEARLPGLVERITAALMAKRELPKV